MGYQTTYGQAGDPFLGGLVKGLLGGVKGAIGGVVKTFLPATNQNPFPIVQQRGPMPQLPALPVSKVPGLRGTLQRLVPGGATGYQTPMQGIPKGYRLNKSGYWTSQGYVAPGTKLVKIRYRNPANAKALRRALSRAESFGGLVKRARKTTRRLKSI